ncbi:hypothetical protein P3T76_004166 [Phytophthora citrophthora]|uniref:Uncharacterized protein n=1 Tax=Phytophthora citrophthora TaxID=4793 RepID=A0AAD9GTC1_9STRA|nr:hypothetical protein P3T76_004166 [Phytophthora citrophthora]
MKIMIYERIEKKVAELAPRLDVMTTSPIAEDVEKGLILLEEVDKYLTFSAYADNFKMNIVVLGTIGRGKSTVVSCLLEDPPIVFHHESKLSRVVVAKSPTPDVPFSGSTMFLPVVKHITLENEFVAVWNMPGSQHTCSPFVESVVHYIYRWMIKDDKKL